MPALDQSRCVRAVDVATAVPPTNCRLKNETRFVLWTSGRVATFMFGRSAASGEERP